MKFFCFLITIVLVNSANSTETYKKAVFLANAAVELAFNKNDLTIGDNSRANGLEHVIEKMINDESYYKCFAKMNFMIVVPDKTHLIRHIRGITRLYSTHVTALYFQNKLREEIQTTLNIDISDDLNGEDLEDVTLTSLAEERRRRVNPSLKNIFRRKLADDVLDFEGLNLTALAEERRVTGTSLENVVRRRVSGTDVVGVQNRPVHDVSLYRLCRLVGLMMSAKFPESYISTIKIDPNNRTFTLRDESTQKVYKKIDGLWWQINPNDPDNYRLQLLEEQLV